MKFLISTSTRRELSFTCTFLW